MSVPGEPEVGATPLRADGRSNDEGAGRRPHGDQAALSWSQGRAEPGRGTGRRRKQRDEHQMVPDVEFQSYYGRAVLKPPVWTHDIAFYLFTGGLAAGSSLLAAGADLTGAPALRRGARATSMGALLASTYFLINDLGVKTRFHHMLRVAKPTSPMSVGTWILAAYGPLAGAAATAELAPLLPERGVLGLVRKLAPWGGRAAGLGAAAVAPALATYTAVLFADTAVPSWHEGYRELPFLFSGSALAAGAGAGLVLAPPTQTASARRLAVAGAAVELAAGQRLEKGHGLLSEPYETGRPGTQLKAARALTAVGAVGAALSRRSRLLSIASGSCLLAGSLLTRFGVFEAGVMSSKDPKYVVVPQRERLERRADGGAKTNAPG
ncbi:formate-dependent nitrite reductase membrane component NrfD [Motilibacter rhizosphaerae]|uniref:Formate-dependent nitrite reductase membrane component NrfD n=1 Tax=Motilibacter rhizosphaerae TaxID=598652 RepID=A0A4Q7NX43_9ACTN|nr:NrfD/PsrC family molybdoenzyme membrane anchor subunit [Motilibacter rhizosphaerae]RZS90972.1 formate-dependent nitrite reductase membrane component NrfD [Motilibacter rhizosphaerae]